MPHRRTTRSLLALAVASTALLLIPACSVVEEVAYQRHASTFDDVTALQEGSDLELTWLPSDATAIRLLESTRDGASDASALVVSSAELDPTMCVAVDRQSAPSLGIDGAPDVYGIESVFACGDWTIAATEDGWYGWTPSHPDEAAQAPS